MYFEHSKMQDENKVVAVSKLPYGSLTITWSDFPCTWGWGVPGKDPIRRMAQ